YDAIYLVHKIEKEIQDVFVPPELVQLIHNIYLAHLRKEVIREREAIPKQPFILVVGPTGSGKTHTIQAAIEQAIFDDTLIIRKDFKAEWEEEAAHRPWLRLPLLGWLFASPELKKLAQEEDRIKQLKRWEKLSHFPLIKKYAQKRASQVAQQLEWLPEDKDSILVDYNTISPHQVQTKWYGETGTYFLAAMGSEKHPTIRHILEAHGVLSDGKGTQGNDVQLVTLQATITETMDKIAGGLRDCILIADTHSPSKIARDIYRRFDEQGIIIDISEFWQREEYLAELIKLELRQNNVNIDCSQVPLGKIVNAIKTIFDRKGLDITPAYVRKLIHSLLEAKGDLRLDYFNDEQLIRECFKNVARNLYGELFQRIVKRPPDDYGWDDYQGSIKDDFLEMVISSLFYGGLDKGVVLAGPPGSGKTFLTMVAVAAYPEITFISIKMDDLYEEGHGIQGIIKNLEGVYDIAKMLAPSLVVINEADAVAKKRSQQGMDPMDAVTNKFLDLLDGDRSVRGTFTVMTTNLLENLDGALIRPGRLKVMSVSGKLGEREIIKIIRRELRDESLAEGLSVTDIYVEAKRINNTPAGYVEFVRKLKELRRVELRTAQRLCQLSKQFGGGEEVRAFCQSNSKPLLRILEVLGADEQLIKRARGDFKFFISQFDLIKEKATQAVNLAYPITLAHLRHARAELLKNPQRQAWQSLDKFLGSELSQEPQVGRVVGAAYAQNMGLLVPINSNLVARPAGGPDIIVTGVTKGSVLQQVDHTEMTFQSAREALTLNIHYFQKLLGKSQKLGHLDAACIVGKLLENRSIHHQMESVNYMGGGPSAGFALAINTLSVLLHLPVYNDFGITGAPSTKGVRADKAGSSVMIGGEDKKAERVLQDLRRMYVPRQNFYSFSFEVQAGYWREGKVVIPVGDYRDIIGEVIYLNEDQRNLIDELIKSRIDYYQCLMRGGGEEDNKEIEVIKNELQQKVEAEICRRLELLYKFLVEEKQQFVNLPFIFK
ncbi:AAA family ATPase, partial [Candidatus Parcubacteria bacterium]